MVLDSITIIKKYEQLYDRDRNRINRFAGYRLRQTIEIESKDIDNIEKTARLRAEQIAGKSGSSLGGLKFAKMGVFQIIARNSNEDYTWAGAYNTSSRKKTALITMHLQYGLD